MTNTQKLLLTASLLIGALFFFKKEKLMYKRNNPLNIRDTSETWQGETGSENGFVVFSSVEYGTRAALKLLYNYITKFKRNTVQEIISHFAPPQENSTENYIQFVCKSLGVSRSAVLLPTQKTLSNLVIAMSLMEQGKQLDQATVLAAWKLTKLG